MKVAISSASFAHRLAAGELTQLEWLENCASTFGADGIVFAREHFARTDGEYVAQLRKVTVDLGLVPLAVAHWGLFAADAGDTQPGDVIGLAGALGALFVTSPLPAAGPVPPATFVAAVEIAKRAVRAAKQGNITLLAQAAPGTLAEDAAGLRHFIKDVDSAWLRCAMPAGADRSAFNARDRVLVLTLAAELEADGLPDIQETARPWILLTGEVTVARIDAVRRAAAKRTLADAGVR